MRNFLITKKTYKCGKLASFEILGMVQGDYSPAFDKETAKKLFGCFFNFLHFPPF